MARPRKTPASAPKAPEKAIAWTRADPAALARFDPASKLCVMNCGPHRLDPRTREECKFLCGDCLTDWNR